MPEQDKQATEANEDQEKTAAAATADDAAEDEFTFVEDPTFDIDYKGECAYEVKVTVPPANTKQQAEKLFAELKSEAQVPGFRPGRAPRKLIERKFAKVVRGEVENKLVTAAFQKLVKNEDLRPIRLPDVDGLKEQKERGQDDPLAFTLTFEVATRVELGKYRGVEIERPVLKIEDSDVESAIDEMRSRYAVYETVKRGKAKDGDQVVIDFAGTVDGTEFPGGAANDYPYILGTKRFFPEFEEVLKGTKANDEVTCIVTLPTTIPNEELRGKKAEFTITVKEIKRRNLPKLDDEFAAKAGYENEEDLRNKVSERLREAAKSQSDQAAEARALAAVVEDSTYEVPKTLIAEVAKDLFEEDVRRLAQMRLPMAQIEEHAAEMRDQARDRAVDEIKRLATLNEIIEAEGIEVSEEDFEQEAATIAQRTGAGVDIVGKYLQNEENRDTYEARIARAKALRFIVDHAAITDKEVSREELSESEDDGNGEDA